MVVRYSNLLNIYTFQYLVLINTFGWQYLKMKGSSGVRVARSLTEFSV